MKNLFQRITVLSMITLFTLNTVAQPYDCATENDQYRNSKNVWIKQNIDHPFSASQIAEFTGLFYYPVDCNLVLNASLVPPPALNVISVETTKGDSVQLYDYGTVIFKLKEKTYNLQAYKNINLPEFQTNPETVFIPIMDETSGQTTFSEGRYLIIQPPSSGSQILLDFNMAVNPYENYNSNYSTIIVQGSNIIRAPMQVGERKYEDR